MRSTYKTLVKLAILAGAVGLAIWGYLNFVIINVNEAVVDDLGNRIESTENIVNTLRKPLITYAEDYSYWNEVSNFIESGDRNWSELYLDYPAVNTYDIDGIWIYNKSMDLVYSRKYNSTSTDEKLPIEDNILLESFKKTDFPFFYVNLHGDIMEIRGASVLREEETRDTAPANGYLLVGKTWDADFLKEISDMSGSRIGFADLITDTASLRPLSNLANFFVTSDYVVYHQLNGIDARPVQTLSLNFLDSTQRSLTHQIRTTLIWLIVFLGGIIIIMGGYFIISHELPLEKIMASILNSNLDKTEELVIKYPEYLPLRNIVSNLKDLEKNMNLASESGKEKSRELRQVRQNLKRLLAEREQFARDLHDNLIQSVYAVGLQIQSCQSLIDKDSKKAIEQLQSSKRNINHVILDIRNFLAGMEPTDLRDYGLYSAINRLVSVFRRTTDCSFSISMDTEVCEAIPEDYRQHVYAIVKELLTNAVKHAQPENISVKLYKKEQKTILEVINDGYPLLTAQNGNPKAGNGLKNIEGRAREMDAEFNLVQEDEPISRTNAILIILDKPGPALED